MDDINNSRIAFLFPSMGRAAYWHPVLREFTQKFKNTIIYTGDWPGFTAGFEDAFTVEVVGAMKYIRIIPSTEGYSVGFSFVSLGIINKLLQFKPDAIFSSAFSVWTLLVLLLKSWLGWRVIIIYDGSSPSIDRLKSKPHLFYRKMMVRLADAFVTNSQGGKNYLTQVLNANENSVFAQPYQVPTPKALFGQPGETQPTIVPSQKPIFLFTGVIEVRKGVARLLEACKLLQAQGYHNYTLLLIGDGPKLEELKLFSETNDLRDRVFWVGWLDYSQLGTYFRHADVFVFPTLEDIWGMVVLEAMALGKPILCSKYAGVSEMIVEGENGYIFDPNQPAELAKLMSSFIDNPDQIMTMGSKSEELIAKHTPQSAAQFLIKITSLVLGVPTTSN